jgi:hypothetical protein
MRAGRGDSRSRACRSRWPQRRSHRVGCPVCGGARGGGASRSGSLSGGSVWGGEQGRGLTAGILATVEAGYLCARGVVEEGEGGVVELWGGERGQRGSRTAYGVGKVGLVVDDRPDLHRRGQSVAATPMPRFVSIGLFLIDHAAPDTVGEIGGGGTYATIGARIWSVHRPHPAPLTPRQAAPVHRRHDRRQGHRLSPPHTPEAALLWRHLALPRPRRSHHRPHPHFLPRRRQMVTLLLSSRPVPNRVSAASSTSPHASGCSRGICEEPASPAPQPCISFALPPARST